MRISNLLTPLDFVPPSTPLEPPDLALDLALEPLSVRPIGAIPRQ